MALPRRSFLSAVSVGAIFALGACQFPTTAFGQRRTPPVIRVGLPTGDYASSQATARLLQPLLDLSKRPPLGARFTVEPVALPAATPTPAPGGVTARPELAALAQALAGGAASGSPVDVMLLVTADDAVLAGAWGLVRPLDPYLETFANAKREAFFPGALAAVTARGHIWGLPLAFSPQVITYDPAYLAEVGAAAPVAGWGWPQFSSLSSALTNPAAKRYALGPFDYLPTYIYQGGGAVLSADGTRSALTETGALAGLAFYQELAQRDKVIAPAGPCQTGPPFTCGGNRIGWELITVANSVPTLPEGARYAPPLKGSTTATAGSVAYVLAVTNHAQEAEAAFAAIIAIADALQPSLVMPSRRSLAQHQPATPLYVTDQAQEVALAAAEVAHAEPLNTAVLAALAQQQVALRNGTATAPQAAKQAAAIIDRVMAEQYTLGAGARLAGRGTCL